MQNNVNNPVPGNTGAIAPIASANAIDNQDSSKITKARKKRPVSERKRKANRHNSENSTGPKTKRGKDIVAGNAITHTLCASIRRFARPEECKIFEEFHKALRTHFQPVGCLEQLLVQEIALCYLKKCRAIQWEMGQDGAATILERLFHSVRPEADSSSDLAPETLGKNADQRAEKAFETVAGAAVPFRLDLILRYDAENDRRLHRKLVQLERIQRERKGEHVPAPISISVDGALTDRKQ